MHVPTRAEQYLDEALLPRTADWALNVKVVPCAKVVAAARRIGAGPRTAVELAIRAPRPPRDTSMGCIHRVTIEAGELQSFCGEGSNQVPVVIALIEGWDGLRPKSLLTCLRAGLSVDEATEYVRAGRDLDPLRALAGLAADSTPVIPIGR